MRVLAGRLVVFLSIFKVSIENFPFSHFFEINFFCKFNQSFLHRFDGKCSCAIAFYV